MVVAPGQQAAKRVEWWRQGDGSVKLFSDAVPDAAGKLSEATGILEKIAHSKCFWAARRAAERQPDPTAIHASDDGKDGAPDGITRAN